MIGTAIGEIHRDRAKLRYGFEAEGARIVAGDPIGDEEGSMGWVIDEPSFVFGAMPPVKTRLSAVLHQEDGTWEMVHMHVSAGILDEKIVDLQAKWGVT